MRRNPIFKVVMLVVGLLLVASVGLRLFRPERRPASSRKADTTTPAAPRPQRALPRPRPPAPELFAPPPAPTPPAEESEVRQMLRGQLHEAKIAREAIEKYLAQNHRTAGGLLAAFVASKDPAYLREAAARHPNDPAVQLAVLMNNAFPAERRQWLEAFKQSALDNSLASYLSARDHFQRREFEAAIDDLVEASNRPRFEHYTVEGMLEMQELLMAAGKSPAEAKVASMLSAPLPHLGPMRQLSAEMAQLQSHYTAVGDAESFQAMSEIGLGLARRLNASEGGKFVIEQLVGMAVENQFLKALAPGSAPEILGQTVQARVEELARQKAELKRLGPLVSDHLPGATEAELITYFDRVKLLGEVEAARWLEARLKER